MPLNTFGDLLELAKNRIDEVDPDPQIDKIIKEGINHAYLFKIPKADKRLKTMTLTVNNGMVNIPSEVFRIEKFNPSLSGSDYRVGDTLFVDLKDGSTMTIIYEANREPLISEMETPEVSDRAKYLLSTYGCYAYHMHRKRANISMSFLREFQEGIDELESEYIVYNDSVEYDSVKDSIYGGDA